MFDIYLNYCEETFGGSHKFTKNGLGYDVLNIHNNRDDFKIVLADKARFGEYTLFHRAYGARLDGSYEWHVQLRSKHLDFLIYCAFAHDFNKYNNIPYNREDYWRFIKDYKKYISEINVIRQTPRSVKPVRLVARVGSIPSSPTKVFGSILYSNRKNCLSYLSKWQGRRWRRRCLFKTIGFFS